MQEVNEFLLDWVHYHIPKIFEIPYSFQCNRNILRGKELVFPLSNLWNHNETISSIHYNARKSNIHNKIPMIFGSQTFTRVGKEFKRHIDQKLVKVLQCKKS